MPLQRYKMAHMYSYMGAPTWGMSPALDGGYYKVEECEAAWADMQLDLANTKSALDQCLSDSAKHFLDLEAAQSTIELLRAQMQTNPKE